MALKPTKSYELIWLQGTFGNVWSTYFLCSYWNHFDFVYPLIKAFRLKLLASIRRVACFYDCVVEVVFHHLFEWACDAQFQFGVWMNLNVSYNCFAPNRFHFQKQTKLRGPVIQIVRKSVLIIDISTETKIIQTAILPLFVLTHFGIIICMGGKIWTDANQYSGKSK